MVHIKFGLTLFMVSNCIFDALDVLGICFRSILDGNLYLEIEYGFKLLFYVSVVCLLLFTFFHQVAKIVVLHFYLLMAKTATWSHSEAKIIASLCLVMSSPAFIMILKVLGLHQRYYTALFSNIFCQGHLIQPQNRVLIKTNHFFGYMCHWKKHTSKFKPVTTP